MRRAEPWAVVPTVAVHLTAAGVHGAAASALGASLGPEFMGGLAALMLGAPVAALAIFTAGHERLGGALLLLSFLGASALGIYASLGMGLLEMVLNSAAETWARPVFFGTAMLMALLQIKGIIEAFRTAFPSEGAEEAEA